MKTLRLLCLLAVYTVSIPWFIIFGTGFFVYLCIQNITYTGKPNVKDIIKSGVEGFKIGHKYNIVWVKYGNNYSIDILIKEMRD